MFRRACTTLFVALGLTAAGPVGQAIAGTTWN